MRKDDASSNPIDSASQVKLVRDRAEKIRSLSGFQKTHRVPDQADDRSSAFVARIATDDIAGHLDELHSELRKQYGYKRRELDVSEILEGSASIQTPQFRYEVSVSIDPDDASYVLWRHRMSEIAEPRTIFDSRFEEVFGNVFNIVEFSAPGGIDVEGLIDCVEDLEDPGIELNYPHDASTCTLQFAGEDVKLLFRRDGMRLVHSHPRPPSELLRVYFELQSSLAGGIVLPAIK